MTFWRVLHHFRFPLHFLFGRHALPHRHRCPDCHRIWAHRGPFYGEADRLAHRCPECDTQQWHWYWGVSFVRPLPSQEMTLVNETLRRILFFLIAVGLACAVCVAIGYGNVSAEDHARERVKEALAERDMEWIAHSIHFDDRLKALEKRIEKLEYAKIRQRKIGTPAPAEAPKYPFDPTSDWRDTGA